MAAKTSDWRKEGQREELRPVMKGVGFCLNIAGFICFFGGLLIGHLKTYWAIICFVILFISLILYLAYTQYFTLLGKDKFKNRVGNKTKISHIDSGIMCAGLTLLIRSLLDFSILNWILLVLFSVATGVVFTLIICFLSREMRENSDLILATVILAVFISGGIVLQLNHIMNEESGYIETCVVTDTDYHRAGRRTISTYNCTVKLNDKAEISLPITREIYRDLELGDQVLVYTGTGALGIEYAYFAGTIN